MPHPLPVTVKPDDLTDQRVRDLLVAHATRARQETKPGSAHAFDLTAFDHPGVYLFTAWQGDHLLGTGAWKRLSKDHGEVKSMHTVDAARGRGVASQVLQAIVADAQTAGVQRLSLETGSWPFWEPARAFYLRHGFTYCDPFGDYHHDPNSVFMTRAL